MEIQPDMTLLELLSHVRIYDFLYLQSEHLRSLERGGRAGPGGYEQGSARVWHLGHVGVGFGGGRVRGPRL